MASRSERLPNPALEWARAQHVDGLRDRFEDACRTVLRMRGAPEQAFNRWLLLQLCSSAQDAADHCPCRRDPLLRRPELATDTDVVRRELWRYLPAPSYIPWPAREDATYVDGLARRYIHSARVWLKHCGSTDEWAHSRLEDAEAELRTGPSATVFAALAADMAPFFRSLLHDLVEHVLRDLRDAAFAAVADLATTATTDSDALVHVFSCRTGRRSGVVGVQFGDRDVHWLRPAHYAKLARLFETHRAGSGQDGSADTLGDFQTCLYVLLRRYRTLIGPDGAGMHAALPPAVFRWLQRELGVREEMFASPLNCYLPRYRSPCPDVDRWFGSRGTFAEPAPAEGSYEVGPPYTEEVMQHMAACVLSWLASTAAPLSFCVFVPDWRQPQLAPHQAALEASRFLRGECVVPGWAHAYVQGTAHEPTRGAVDTEAAEERAQDRHPVEPDLPLFVLPFDTRVYVLQNEAGARCWPVSAARMAELRDTLCATVPRSSGRRQRPGNDGASDAADSDGSRERSASESEPESRTRARRHCAQGAGDASV